MPIRINGVDKESKTNVMADLEHGMHLMTAKENRKLYEPMRSSDFEFIVTDLDNLVNPVTGEAAGPNAAEYLRLSVISAPVPRFSIDPIEIRRVNSVGKYAGLPSFPSGTIRCQDWIGSGSKDILAAWLSLAYNQDTDKVGLKSEYGKDCYLVEYTPDKQPIRVWEMYGCWVSSIQEDDFDHTNGDARTFSCDLQYDYAKLIPGSSLGF